MFYFAYGSNMNWVQMKNRCPSACFYCIAKLKDHKMDFTRESKERGCGVADVVEENGVDVWGVVYKIDKADIGKLDKSEGFNPGQPHHKNSYVREERIVYSADAEDQPLTVSIYIANKQNQQPLPNKCYKNLIVEGAVFWHLPDEYISKLRRIRTEN